MNLRVECPACHSQNVKQTQKYSIRLHRFTDYIIWYRCEDCQNEFVVGG